MFKSSKKIFFIFIPLFLLIGISIAILLRNSNGMVLGDSVQDINPPEMLTLEFNKNTINTQNSDDSVTISSNITDDLSGVLDDSLSVRMEPINKGGQFIDFVLDLSTGDDMNGIYTATATFPKGSANGTWVISSIYLSDKIGNSLVVDHEPAEYNVENIRITNEATTSDTIAPTVTLVSIPVEFRTVNTSENSQAVQVDIGVSDNMAGIGTVSVRIMPPQYTGQAFYLNMVKTGENGLTQTYTGSGSLPKGSMNGYWEVESIVITDRIGNMREYPASTGIIAQMFGIDNSRINNTSPTFDNTAPIITNYSVTPSEFNTSIGPVVLTVNITVHDDNAGINTPPNLRLFPQISTQFRDAQLTLDQQISEVEASYTGTISIPQYSKVGIWEPTLNVSDRINNVKTYYTQDIYDSFPNAQGVILVNTATDDQVTVDKNWVISTPNITATIPSGTVITKKNGGVFALYRMLTQTYDVTDYPTLQTLFEQISTQDEPDLISDCVIEESCQTSQIVANGLGGSSVGFVRVGVPGLNLQFSKAVTLSLVVDPKYNGAVLDIQSFQEGGALWSNETICTVSSSSRCNFTVNHASFFTANYKPSGSLKINSNASQTYSRYVTLNLSASSKLGSIRYMRMSNNGTKWSGWVRYSTSYRNWDLYNTRYGGTTKEGTRSVRVQFKDSLNNISQTYTASTLFNPRRVSPITVLSYVKRGKAPKEYVLLQNRLRGNISMSSWSFTNLAGRKRTIPSITIKEGSYIKIAAGRGTNTSTKVYIGLSSTSEIWRDSGYDLFQLYNNRGVVMYKKYIY